LRGPNYVVSHTCGLIFLPALGFYLAIPLKGEPSCLLHYHFFDSVKDVCKKLFTVSTTPVKICSPVTAGVPAVVGIPAVACVLAGVGFPAAAVVPALDGFVDIGQQFSPM